MDCEKHFYIEHGQIEGMHVITYQGAYLETECPHCRIEILRDEMKLIALALGRSKTDGESDCDWYDISGDVEAIKSAAEQAYDTIGRIQFPAEIARDMFLIYKNIGIALGKIESV